MKDARRLEPLTSIASIRARDAARRLAGCVAEVEAKEIEAARLREYLDDYRGMRNEARAVPSARWQSEQRFLAQLGEAVALKERELARAAQQLEEEYERWRKSHRSSKTLDEMLERYRSLERHDRERLEQEDTEEALAARLSHDH